jgi:7-carboxy-7-deazaguanine synthase (Cx14CxxC type)
MYSVKEIYYTLQGEGAQAGRAAVFCRFSGCNLWSGRETDRASALCRFCDTDFVGTDGVGGGRFNAGELSDAIGRAWPLATSGKPYVVFTGGEPLLQLDEKLVNAVHSLGFEVGVETNGTMLPPCGIDWLCVSPKANGRLVVDRGDEIKLVFPQAGVAPDLYEHLDFRHFYLQPMDNASLQNNTEMAIRYCLENPRWRLSLQSHKKVGIR